MFRDMRRKRQVLVKEECDKILKRGTSGVLALQGDDGFPYAVPISYLYDGSKLYFHCAKAGHKIDAIMRSPKASFCVIDQDRVVPEKYTTYFRSVIVFGTIRIIDDEREIAESIEKLALKYAPDDSAESRKDEIARYRSSLCMLEMMPEHISGKQAKELMNPNIIS